MEGYDVVIIGMGLAGVYCALSIDDACSVALIANGSIEQTNSYLAQGGVAAPVGDGDSAQKHFEDTWACGHNLGNQAAIKQLTYDATAEIKRLEAFGVHFDMLESGAYLLGMEGAHSMPRILRVGDYTGKAIMQTLWERVLEKKNIHIFDHTLVYGLETYEDQKMVKALIGDKPCGFVAPQVVFATGGVSRLYHRTSNNTGLMGLGIAPAIAFGVQTSHLNWIQFHPTVFHHSQGGSQDAFLISEAVRGEGAYLLNEKLERFMVGRHPKAELAPRDVVSRAIYETVKEQSLPHVWLDVRHIGVEHVAKRFPTIYAYCCEQGLDLSKDLIPVSPGAHYTMGGIQTDLNGKTNIEGIYAIGECANTGVHGKNRLASNSLLEAMVFASKAAQNICKSQLKTIDVIINGIDQIPHFDFNLDDIATWMDDHLGVEKNMDGVVSMIQLLEHRMRHPDEIRPVNAEDVIKNNTLIVLKELLAQEVVNAIL